MDDAAFYSVLDGLEQEGNERDGRGLMELAL